jgi:hypothetical protein
MSLRADWVEVIFTKLSLAYGRDFLGRWEGLDLDAVKADWAHELAGFAGHRDAIAHALAHLPPKPPTVLEFRAICRMAPTPDVARLEAPVASVERRDAQLARLQQLQQLMRPAAGVVGQRAWAHKVMERVQRGERVSPYTVRQARAALGVA